jgi:hypothetical protein
MRILSHPRSGKRFDAVFVTFKLIKIVSTAFLSFLINGKSFRRCFYCF